MNKTPEELAEIERLARVLRDEFEKQLNGKPIPGIPDVVDSWTATGGELNLTDFATLAYDTLRVGEMRKALEFYADEKNYNDNGAPFQEVCAEKHHCQELDVGKNARQVLNPASIQMQTADDVIKDRDEWPDYYPAPADNQKGV